jgi:hypothetical protein
MAKTQDKPMRRIKLIFDIVLLLLFGAMCNTHVTGTEFHEVAGIMYAALIVVHLIINHKWLTAAFKGKLRGKRSATLSVVNISLFVDLVVILITGLRASHFLLPAAVKAPEYFLAIHAVCGIVAALLVLTHVLLHAKEITKNKLPQKVAFVAVLTIVIGYSLFGTVQGTLKWAEGRDSKPGFEQHDSTNGENVHNPKDGERK